VAHQFDKLLNVLHEFLVIPLTLNEHGEHVHAAAFVRGHVSKILTESSERPGSVFDFNTSVPLQNGEQQRDSCEMECKTKDELEQHLSDIRKLATAKGLTAEEKDAAVRAERFAISILSEHDASGHGGKRCPFATRLG
jgi:hypothetical protein